MCKMYIFPLNETDADVSDGAAMLLPLVKADFKFGCGDVLLLPKDETAA